MIKLPKVLPSSGAPITLSFPDYPVTKDGDEYSIGLPESYQIVERVTTAQMNAILDPVASQLIFNTTTGYFNRYTGTDWVQLIDESKVLPQYSDNASAKAGGLTDGRFYLSGDTVKQVHP